MIRLSKYSSFPHGCTCVTPSYKTWKTKRNPYSTPCIKVIARLESSFVYLKTHRNLACDSGQGSLITFHVHFESTVTSHRPHTSQYCIAAVCNPCLFVVWPPHTQNSLVTSEPFPSHSLLQDRLPSGGTGRGLVLSNPQKNYAHKGIFLVSLKFSLQIFWPQGQCKHFSVVLSGFSYSLKTAEAFYL